MASPPPQLSQHTTPRQTRLGSPRALGPEPPRQTSLGSPRALGSEPHEQPEAFWDADSPTGAALPPAAGEGQGAVATGKRPLDALALATPEAVPSEDEAQEKRARVEGGATGASGGADAPATAALQASAHALYMERSDAGVVPSERCEQEHWEQAWTGAPVPVGTTHPMLLLRDSITAVEGGRPIDDVLVNTAMHLAMTEPHWRHAEPWHGEGLARVLFHLRETTSKMLLDGHLHWAPSEDEQEEGGDSGSRGGSASPGEPPDSGRAAAESESDASMADSDASEQGGDSLMREDGPARGE